MIKALLSTSALAGVKLIQLPAEGKQPQVLHVRRLQELACLLQGFGNPKEACQCMEQAVLASGSGLQGDSEASLGPKNMLAALKMSMGQLPEAEQLLRDCLQLEERLFPGQARQVVMDTLAHQIAALVQREELGEVDLLGRRCVEMAEAAYGREGPRTARALAHVLQKRGRLEEACGANERAIQLFQSADAAGCVDAAAAMANLANLLYLAGSWAEAEETYRKSLQAYSQVKGKSSHSQDAAAVQNNLGMVMSQLGKHDEAEKLCSEASVQIEKLLGKEHPSSLASQEKLAVILQAKYSFPLPRASRLFQQAYNGYKRAEAAKTAPAAVCANGRIRFMRSLGLTYHELKSLDRARAALNSSLEEVEKRGGLGDPRARNIPNYLALICMDEGNDEEAEATCRRILEVAGCREDPEVQMSAEVATATLAVILGRQGRQAEAAALVGNASKARTAARPVSRERQAVVEEISNLRDGKG